MSRLNPPSHSRFIVVLGLDYLVPGGVGPAEVADAGLGLGIEPLLQGQVEGLGLQTAAIHRVRTWLSAIGWNLRRRGMRTVTSLIGPGAGQGTGCRAYRLALRRAARKEAPPGLCLT
jgi:hypothetical protein